MIEWRRLCSSLVAWNYFPCVGVCMCVSFLFADSLWFVDASHIDTASHIQNTKGGVNMSAAVQLLFLFYSFLRFTNVCLGFRMVLCAICEPCKLAEMLNEYSISHRQALSLSLSYAFLPFSLHFFLNAHTHMYTSVYS